MYLRCQDVQPEYARCHECGLFNMPFVPGQGPDTCQVAVVGEAPGISEVKEGKPFAAKSNELLTKAMGEAGIDRRFVYATNAVLGNPDLNRAPEPEEVQACNQRLWNELLEHRPKVVIALGSTAMSALGLHGSLPGKRGSIHTVEVAIESSNPSNNAIVKVNILATRHPEEVFRDQKLYLQFVSDLQVASKFVSSDYTEAAIVQDMPLNLTVASDWDSTLSWARDNLWEFMDYGDDHAVEFAIAVENAEGHGAGDISIALCRDPSRVLLIPAPMFADKDGIENFNEFLSAHSKGGFAAFDGKAVCHALWRAGLTAKNASDVMLWDYALNMTATRAQLPDVLQRLTNVQVDRYAPITTAAIASCVARCQREIANQFSNTNAKSVYENILMPGSKALSLIEHVGIKVDREMLETLSETLSAQSDAALDAIRESIGDKSFNPNSQKQLTHLLFDVLDLPKVNGTSTDSSVLDALTGQHPVVEYAKQYRQAKKYKTTFIDSLHESIDSNGRVHTNYHLNGTVTGRLSSSGPNLQNIPHRHGAEIRNLFEATKGYTMISCDLSQAELRVAAYMANDEALLDIFRHGRDPHAETAAKIFKQDIETISVQQRTIAKAVNFGIIYGASPSRVSDMTGMPTAEAQETISAWFKAFPRISEWLDSTWQKVRLGDAVLSTPFSRSRRFAMGGDLMTNLETMRQSTNFPVQSTASDLTLLALIEAVSIIDWRETRILLAVHDSILIETKAPHPEEVAVWLKEMMLKERLPGLPLDAELQIGNRWGSMENPWRTVRP